MAGLEDRVSWMSPATVCETIEQLEALDEMLFFGPLGTEDCQSITGDTWSGVDLAPLYLALLPYVSRADKIVQVGGGVSPILYYLSNLHPELVGRMMAYDLDPRFNSSLNGRGLGYSFVTGDASELGQLGLDKPSLVFSFMFLDSDFFTYGYSDGVCRSPSEAQAVVAFLLNRMVEALPEGSVLLTQVKWHDHIVDNHWVGDDPAFFLLQDKESTVWSTLEARPECRNHVLFSESYEGIAPVIITEKVSQTQFRVPDTGVYKSPVEFYALPSR